ncbi:hypothetical protein K435DRAFT_705214 [Dendrothele bispora CBS 962.96]|uniref:Uncharacterized protein n=1 Tax=Dendrothele bispora (strain CBS 962.96) TaxID=1314807 RepID=A0A4S8KL29_DENBC|nr:hypothetical protein K435DRAFT_705214 [Dendrothele bispora CBS 962.96]
MPPIALLPAGVAGIIFSTFAHGVFFFLWITSMIFKFNHIAASISHPYPYSRSHLWQILSIALKHPLVPGSFLLFFLITGHWICQMIRIFELVTQIQNNSGNPNIFFTNLADRTKVIDTVFLVLSLTAGDCIIIYRLWIIWGYCWQVTVIPVLTTCGLLACSIGTTYQFSQYQAGDNIFQLASGRWILTLFNFLYSTNGYCASLSILTQKLLFFDRNFIFQFSLPGKSEKYRTSFPAKAM